MFLLVTINSFPLTNLYKFLVTRCWVISSLGCHGTVLANSELNIVVPRYVFLLSLWQHIFFEFLRLFPPEILYF